MKRELWRQGEKQSGRGKTKHLSARRRQSGKEDIVKEEEDMPDKAIRKEVIRRRKIPAFRREKNKHNVTRPGSWAEKKKKVIGKKVAVGRLLSDSGKRDLHENEEGDSGDDSKKNHTTGAEGISASAKSGGSEGTKRKTKRCF